jgi:deoxyribonuclease-4
MSECTKKFVLLGAHMSISQGLDKSLYTGARIGCTTIQIFTHSNRQWTIKDITDERINQFKKAKKDTQIYEIVVHSSYLINLGSKSYETVEKSIDALKKELDHCRKLGISYLVLHPGSGHKDPYECCTQIAENINKVFSESNSETLLLLENMAGQGTSVGYTFDQLAYIISHVKEPNRLGICFDTCHAFAAGYDFSTPELYNKMWKEFDEKIGIDKLKVIHMNNSKKPCGSKVDRHDHIKDGLMPLKSFELIMNDPRFKNIPKILETPKEKDLKEDVENINTLLDLRKC